MKKLLLTLLLITLPFAIFADWELIDSYQFSDVNLNTNPKTFNNLLGDKYDYKLITRLDAVDSDTASSELRMYFNNDDPSVPDNNYRYYKMHGTNATAAASVNNAQAFIPIANVGDANALYSSFSEFYIFGSSGNERLIEGSIAGYDTNAPYIYEVNGSYLTTADEITHINIYDETSQNTSGAIYLFRRLKKQYQGNGWELVEKQSVTAQDMRLSPAGTPVVFNNLLGDKDIKYKIEVEATASGGGTLTCRINGDDTFTNYKYQELRNTSGTLTAQVLDYPQVLLPLNTSDNLGVLYLSPKSGNYQTSIAKTFTPTTLQLLSANWFEVTDEITSIEIVGDSAATVTGTFKLYKRSKNRSSYGKRLIYDYDINGDFSGGKTFKNLKNNKMYEIVFSDLISGGEDGGLYSAMNMKINSETSYDRQYLFGRSSSVIAGSASISAIEPALADVIYSGKGRMLLMPYNNGNYRCMLQQRAYGYNGTNNIILTEALWWKNTADDIQDITIYSGDTDTVTGNIKIYEIDLPEKTIDDLQPDMSLWLDAADSSTITEDVGVSQWDDKSGKDNHAVQAVGANQPTYDTDKLVFDGTNDYMGTTSHVSAIDGESTIFVVGTTTQANGTDNVLIMNGSSGAVVYYCGIYSTFSSKFPIFAAMNADGLLALNIAINVADTTPRIWTVVKPANNAVSHFSINNGTPVTTASTNTVSFDNTRIGVLETNSGTFYSYLSGSIREIVVFSKELSENDRMVVMKYLSKKWNIKIGE